MNWEVMFPGRFIKSAEFAGKKPTLTIKSITLEDLPEDKGGTKRRGIISFKETPKALVLNRTNGTAFKAMFGVETDAWVGKRITLWAAPFTDPFTGEQITAIRVLGSPDIKANMEFSAKIGRKQVVFRLSRTGAVGQRLPAPAGTPAPDYPPPAPAPMAEPPEDMVLPTLPEAPEEDAPF